MADLHLLIRSRLGYSLPQKNAIGQPPVPKPPGAIEPGVSNAEALNKLQQDGTPAPSKALGFCNFQTSLTERADFRRDHLRRLREA